MKKMLKRAKKNLDGYKTYISLAFALIVWVAMSRGWLPDHPEIRFASIAVVGAFLRAGVGNKVTRVRRSNPTNDNVKPA